MSRPAYLPRLLLPISTTGENNTKIGTAQIIVRITAAAIPVPVGVQGKKRSAGKLEQYMALSSPFTTMTTAIVTTIKALKVQEAIASRNHPLINSLPPSLPYRRKLARQPKRCNGSSGRVYIDDRNRVVCGLAGIF